MSITFVACSLWLCHTFADAPFSHSQASLGLLPDAPPSFPYSFHTCSSLLFTYNTKRFQTISGSTQQFFGTDAIAAFEGQLTLAAAREFTQTRSWNLLPDVVAAIQPGLCI